MGVVIYVVNHALFRALWERGYFTNLVYVCICVGRGCEGVVSTFCMLDVWCMFIDARGSWATYKPIPQVVMECMHRSNIPFSFHVFGWMFTRFSVRFQCVHVFSTAGFYVGLVLYNIGATCLEYLLVMRVTFFIEIHGVCVLVSLEK